MSEPFDVEALDDIEPFEVDEQASHLFKHPHLGMDDLTMRGAGTRCSTRLGRPLTG